MRRASQAAGRKRLVAGGRRCRGCRGSAQGGISDIQIGGALNGARRGANGCALRARLLAAARRRAAGRAGRREAARKVLALRVAPIEQVRTLKGVPMLLLLLLLLLEETRVCLLLLLLLGLLELELGLLLLRASSLDLMHLSAGRTAN